MKILYFDCFSGISGDMALGALIDLGADAEDLKNELHKLKLSGYRLSIKKEVRHGISGTDVEVVTDKINNDYEHHGRRLKDIVGIIESSELSAFVKAFSIKVFNEIARAEAKVHGESIDDIHFHEVGAIDSIVDIAGVGICLDFLGIDKVMASPLHEGQGFIECSHGILPVPVPAVMEMLAGSGIPVIVDNIDTELITPTGLGIIKCLASDFKCMPPMSVERTGYGMGKRSTGKLNALRAILGTLSECKYTPETIVSLETNIDDMNPEILGYVTELLFENGALDVFHTPVYMKKNRPAFMLTVLSKPENEQALADIIFRESSTTGIRRTLLNRYIMNREIIRISTDFGQVDVKVSGFGTMKKYSPEYEDCKKIARAAGVPLREIYENVMKNIKY